MQVAAFDVSKKTLEVCNGGRIGSISNDDESIRSYLERLDKGTVLAAEATGIWHRRLADIGCEMGFTVIVANPKRVRHYARSEAYRGKTDRLDAQVIEAFVKDKHGRLKPYTPAPAVAEQTRVLITRRASLAKARAMVDLSLRGCDALKGATKLATDGLDAAIKEVDKELAKLLKGEDGYKLLQTIPGVGLLIGAALYAHLSRHHFASSDAFVAYLGLDPRPNDSGPRTGRRRLTKQGDSEGRRLAYLAAMAACRHEPFKAYYQAQKDKGLSSTAALIVLARKLVRVAYAVHKSKKPFSSP